MAAAAAPAAPQGSCSSESLGVGVWSRVDVEAGAGPGEDTFHRQPCQRSLHVAAVLKDNLLVFGGYDGSNRCVMRVCLNMAPSSTCAAHSHSRYLLHAVHNCTALLTHPTYRVNDFYRFNFKTRLWSRIEADGHNPPPSPRDRHVAVVYENSFFVFGGFDGNSRVNDFYEYSFDTNVSTMARFVHAIYHI